MLRSHSPLSFRHPHFLWGLIACTLSLFASQILAENRSCRQLILQPFVLEVPNLDFSKLGPVSDSQTLRLRLQQIPELRGEAISVGEYVFAPGLPSVNLAYAYRKELPPPRIWKFHGEMIEREINISEFLIMTIVSSEISLYRKMTLTEFKAWEKKSPDILSEVTKYRAPSWRHEYGANALHFSISMPFTLHALVGKELVHLRIPKTQLLSWASQGKIIVGGTSDLSMFEIVALENSWAELLDYYSKSFENLFSYKQRN